MEAWRKLVRRFDPQRRKEKRREKQQRRKETRREKRREKKKREEKREATSVQVVIAHAGRQVSVSFWTSAKRGRGLMRAEVRMGGYRSAVLPVTQKRP